MSYNSKIKVKIVEYSYDDKIILDGTEIGNGKPCYIIAEIGINHNGNVSLAKKLIDVASKSGANAVKFQKRDLDMIYRKEILENPNLDSQGTEILIPFFLRISASLFLVQTKISMCFIFIKLRTCLFPIEP